MNCKEIAGINLQEVVLYAGLRTSEDRIECSTDHYVGDWNDATRAKWHFNVTVR